MIGPPGISQRIPARSSADAQTAASSREGSWATAEKPSGRRYTPMEPLSVQPPSAAGVSHSRPPLPLTVVAFIRISRSTPSG